MPAGPVPEAQVHDAATRLLTAMLETKRWDLTSWLDFFNQGAPEEPAIDANREYQAQAWLSGQRGTVERYVGTVLALDPQWFHDQAAAASSAESAIRVSIGDPPASVDHDGEALSAAVARVDRQLQQWQGEGADAFKERVQEIRTFDLGQANLLVELGMAMVGGREAVHAARRAFVAVCDDAVAALGEYRATESAREGRVALYLSVGILAGLCTFGAGAAAFSASALAGYVFSFGGASAAVGQVVNTGNSVALTSIPAPDLEAAVAGFRGNADRVLQALDDEMADMARKLADFDREYGRDPRLLAPLPPATDVHAPGYTYDDLRSEDRPPSAGFDTAVRDAASATARPQGAITRALEPGR